MRTIAMLGAGAALLIGGGAMAQVPGAPFPPPGMGVNHPPLPPAPMQGRRWGSQVGGRWWGGANAPGGWAAYRRPYRGYRVPTYWVAPRFYVTDWSRYGLYAPTSGYNWVRYYDDAVLVDRDGGVSDWRGGLSWDGGDQGQDYAYDNRRGDGVGGAVAGAVVGGVAGNVVAGRGNRLGGTLIGAGVGAAAGYGIDRASGRGRRGPPVYGRDDHGPPPPQGGHWEWRQDGDGPPLPPGHPAIGLGEPLPPGHPAIGPGPSHWSGRDGRTTVTTTTSGGYEGGYGRGPVIVTGGGYGVTTVTIQSAPVVTTTTTEIIEDTVTYSRPAVRRVVRHRVWRPRPACVCPPVRVRVRHHRVPAVIGS